jgi:hypothetical protein
MRANDLKFQGHAYGLLLGATGRQLTESSSLHHIPESTGPKEECFNPVVPGLRDFGHAFNAAQRT